MQMTVMRYGAATDRRETILARLRQSGFVAIAEIARQLKVSEMTVRRDLQRLAAEGELRLVHGGASLPAAIRAEPSREPAFGNSFDSRATTDIAAKRAIARRALAMIAPGDTIGLDAGTTVLELARLLPDDVSGTVVSHSLAALDVLADRPALQVIALGGDLHRPSRAFVGPSTTEGAARLRLRTFFLGAAAIDARGIYVTSEVERPTKLALMAIADQVVLLVDGSKCNRSAPVWLCGYDALHGLITDTGLSEDLLKSLNALALHVEQAAE